MNIYKPELRMWDKTIRIGTRESQLAVWQAEQVKNLLEQNGYDTELVFITSEGDTDLVTPLYAMGVQGVFTRSLDTALLNNRIDIAVHSMKDVPVQLPAGIAQAAVLPRASHKDILVFKESDSKPDFESIPHAVIATSSVRRKAQWLHRYPNHTIENLRGNVNTRLRKLSESNWHGAIFAAAGLERINLRPESSFDLDWMLPAPAQGVVVVVAREEDEDLLKICNEINDAATAMVVKVERDFLSALLGGCSTPISALARIADDTIFFEGNIVSPDGKNKVVVEKSFSASSYLQAGNIAAQHLLDNGAKDILHKMQQQDA